MAEPPKESSKIDRKSHAETRHLCAWMGLSLITWQAAEDAHDRAPERGVIGRVRQGWPDHHNAAILATSIVRSSQT